MILITGANGLIGRALTEYFLNSGQRVRVQVRKRAALQSSLRSLSVHPEIMEVDFHAASDLEMRRLVEGCTTVIHAAGLVHQPQAAYQEYELLNVRTTQQLAEAAAGQKIDSFVFLSTIAVYGDGVLNQVDEKTPIRPHTPYAVSKARSEEWLKTFAGFRRTIVLRPALVFGEGDRGNILKLIRQINKGLYFHIGAAKSGKSIIYSRDLSCAIARCLNHAGEGYSLFNLANPQPATVGQLADDISICLGRKTKLPTLPAPLIRVGANLAQRILGNRSPVTHDQIEKLTTTTTCSVAELIKLTQFEPAYTLRQSLELEINWARAERLLEA